MTAALIDLTAAVMGRLRATITDLHHTTAGALDFEALVAAKQLPARLPAAFVIGGQMEAASDERAGRLGIRLAEGVAVVLMQGSLRDATGAAARAAIWPLQLAALTALTGWRPAAGYAPLAPVSSRLQGIGGDVRTGAVTVTLEFVTSFTWHVTPFE